MRRSTLITGGTPGFPEPAAHTTCTTHTRPPEGGTEQSQGTDPSQGPWRDKEAKQGRQAGQGREAVQDREAVQGQQAVHGQETRGSREAGGGDRAEPDRESGTIRAPGAVHTTARHEQRMHGRPATHAPYGQPYRPITPPARTGAGGSTSAPSDTSGPVGRTGHADHTGPAVRAGRAVHAGSAGNATRTGHAAGVGREEGLGKVMRSRRRPAPARPAGRTDTRRPAAARRRVPPVPPPRPADLFADRLVAVLSGQRPVHWMLDHTVSPAYDELVRLAELTPLRSPEGAPAEVRGIGWYAPREGTVEAFARVSTDGRLRAMAFRLEQNPARRWRCTAVDLGPSPQSPTVAAPA